ncbi:MAG: KOW domain-containing RNA-binding protein [Clostridia bacterium]|nr:KOW domain-containing RNA-binding protein [Clostridia bacterium]MBQ8792932.1 KOW domain-containing RNA-binding protein [Clostridia bacterium]
MEKGCVVEALAGKEKGQIFVVINLDDKYAYLSDGKRLKASKPKRKSFKHIKFKHSSLLSEAELLDTNERVNAKIRKILSNVRREYV